jgi:hypothetical protein
MQVQRGGSQIFLEPRAAEKLSPGQAHDVPAVEHLFDI